MSKRKWSEARHTGVRVLRHGQRLGQDRVTADAALVFEAENQSLVVEGSRDELIDFTKRQVGVLKQMINDLSGDDFHLEPLPAEPLALDPLDVDDLRQRRFDTDDPEDQERLASDYDRENMLHGLDAYQRAVANGEFDEPGSPGAGMEL